MRALVTGGAGFIGSHLVDALLARGDEVLVLDDLSSGSRENVAPALEAGAELVVADVRDAERIEDEFGRFRPELVFHLAAQIDVRRSVADPAFDAAVNVVGTANVLQAALAASTRRFVFASTGGAIYGEGEGRTLPFSEAAECEPEAPYGQSKLAAEGYCRLYERLHGLRGSCLRLGNVYGPRQDPRGEAGVMAIFCDRLLRGESPTVFGDGRQTRDYVYVADVVAALLAASESDSSTGIYNVGTGVETSVLEIVEGLARVGESPGWEPELAPARAGEVQRAVLDPTLASAELGWRVQTALLDEGLRLTLEWARSASR